MARATTGLAYAIVGIALLGGLIFTVFVTVPAWSALGTARGVLAERIAARDDRQTFLANVDARVEEFKRYERDAQVLAVAFPESEAPADLVAVLGGLASRNGVTVSTVEGPNLRKLSLAVALSVAPEGPTAGSAGGAAQGTRQNVFETKAKVRGTYAALNAFVRDLEKSVRLLDIPELSLRSAFEGQNIEALLTLVTYSAVVRDQVPGADLAGATPSVSEPPSGAGVP